MIGKLPAGLAWKTHEDDVTLFAATIGTCLQGELAVSYYALEAKFGRPLSGDEVASESTAEWCIEFATPEGVVIATIYDWSLDTCRCRAQTHWHIGGFDKRAVECVQRALWDVLRVQPVINEGREAA